MALTRNDLDLERRTVRTRRQFLRPCPAAFN